MAVTDEHTLTENDPGYVLVYRRPEDEPGTGAALTTKAAKVAKDCAGARLRRRAFATFAVP